MAIDDGATRRTLLARLAAVSGALLACRVTLPAQRMSPQPLPSPNAPANQNVPGGLDGSGLAHQPGKPALNPLAWSAIKGDADKLLQMATDLKAQIDQTNISSTLPLPLIKEAHQIEKMAKQLQNQMRG